MLTGTPPKLNIAPLACRVDFKTGHLRASKTGQLISAGW
jgi:hypothetical protein